MGFYCKVNGNKVIKTSNFWSLAPAFHKKIFKTIFIIHTALLLIKYTTHLFFNKAELVQLLLIDNAGKLWYLPFIILAFYSNTRN